MSADDPVGFEHTASLYANAEQLVASALPFLREGAEQEAAMLVAMRKRGADQVREALAGEEAHICFMELDEVGRNPARLISLWRELSERQGSARRVRCVSEVLWPGRDAAATEECERHEMLVNFAFAASPDRSLLCLYNESGLDEGVLARIGAAHHTPRGGGSTRHNSDYVDPVRSRPFAGQLPPAAGPTAEISFDLGQLAQSRRFLAAEADRLGLDSGRIEDLVTAGNEIATNSIEHGGGRGSMRVWAEEGDILCEVSDAGRFDSPLAGRLHPGLDQLGGRGLWLANQICDLVQIRSGDGGSTVRLRMALAG